MDYIAFFCALKHSTDNEDFLLNSLLSYDIGEYLIVRETAQDSHKLTNGEHYHFLVQMKNDDYTRYRKRVFIDRYKLRGQAKGGMGRQYGKVNYLKDPDRMAVYMLKETKDNVVATTMTPQQLDSWKEQSFKKGEKDTYKDRVEAYVVESLWKSHRDVLLQVMGETYANNNCAIQVQDIHHEIAKCYVRFVRENAQSKDEQNPYKGKKLSLTRAQIKNFQNYFILFNDIFKYVDDNIILSLIN